MVKCKLNMCEDVRGGESLYGDDWRGGGGSRVNGIMGNDHMGTHCEQTMTDRQTRLKTLPSGHNDSQTDMTENITLRPLPRPAVNITADVMKPLLRHISLNAIRIII